MESPSDSEVKEGNTLQIPCRAQGRPNVRIVWDRINYMNSNQPSSTVTEDMSKFLEQETHEELLAKAKIMSLRSKREKQIIHTETKDSNSANSSSLSPLLKKRRRRKRSIILMDDSEHLIPDLYIDENARDKRDQDHDFLLSEFKQIMRDENQEGYDATFKRRRRRRKRDIKEDTPATDEEEATSDGEDDEDEGDDMNGEIGVSEPIPTLIFSTPVPPQVLKRLEVSNNGELIIRNASAKDQVNNFNYELIMIYYE